MGSKNAVNKPLSRSIRKQLSAGQAEGVDLSDLRGLPPTQQKEVRVLLTKINALQQAGMRISAARLEGRARQIIQRCRAAAKNGPNPLTGV